MKRHRLSSDPVQTVDDGPSCRNRRKQPTSMTRPKLPTLLSCLHRLGRCRLFLRRSWERVVTRVWPVATSESLVRKPPNLTWTSPNAAAILPSLLCSTVCYGSRAFCCGAASWRQGDQDVFYRKMSPLTWKHKLSLRSVGDFSFSVLPTTGAGLECCLGPLLLRLRRPLGPGGWLTTRRHKVPKRLISLVRSRRWKPFWMGVTPTADTPLGKASHRHHHAWKEEQYLLYRVDMRITGCKSLEIMYLWKWTLAKWDQDKIECLSRSRNLTLPF